MNFEEFISTGNSFIERFNIWAERSLPKAIADRICFKCASEEEFEAMRAMLEPMSVYIHQSWISGRRISIVKLKTGFATHLGAISFVELSDQKPDKSQMSGFDHIEIYPSSGGLAQLINELENIGEKFEKVVRPHHTTYDTKIFKNFKVRLENEALIEKIKLEEMK